jgi:hypothetical protein
MEDSLRMGGIQYLSATLQSPDDDQLKGKQLLLGPLVEEVRAMIKEGEVHEAQRDMAAHANAAKPRAERIKGATPG